jgi:prophage tail gpP-like protein
MTTKVMGRPKARPTMQIRVPETAADLVYRYAEEHALSVVDAAGELIAAGAKARRLRAAARG